MPQGFSSVRIITPESAAGDHRQISLMPLRTGQQRGHYCNHLLTWDWAVRVYFIVAILLLLVVKLMVFMNHIVCTSIKIFCDLPIQLSPSLYASYGCSLSVIKPMTLAAADQHTAGDPSCCFYCTAVIRGRHINYYNNLKPSKFTHSKNRPQNQRHAALFFPLFLFTPY